MDHIQVCIAASFCVEIGRLNFIIGMLSVDLDVSYFIDAIDYPHTLEQLRTTSIGRKLRPLVVALSENVHHPAIVAALLLVITLFFMASTTS
jgi:hypothetical protein